MAGSAKYLVPSWQQQRRYAKGICADLQVSHCRRSGSSTVAISHPGGRENLEEFEDA